MNWVHSVWMAGILVAFASGYNTMPEGRDLSMFGYHLCAVNETQTVSCVVVRATPYTVQRPCGGWLSWMTCPVTLYKMTYGTEYKEVTREVVRCCGGFVRVGGYCALPLNRTREFTTKPGVCPSTDEGLPDGCERCVRDIDCTAFSHYETNGGWSLNVTVTVKTDYRGMMEGGLLNHTRLLHALVSGALDSSGVSVQYLSSCPVDPYRTASSLIIGSNATLPLDDTRASIQLLLRDIAEVTSVTVEDVDECAHPVLRNCSPWAECSNTVASYNCTCHHGYKDVHPQNAGASCEGVLTIDRPATDAPACATPGATLDGPAENHTRPTDSAPTAPQTSPAASTGATPPQESPTCAPPQLTQLSLSNITGTSFSLYWSSPSPRDQTSYRVVLKKGSEVISYNETNDNTFSMTGLDFGVLYSVTVTPWTCDGDTQGESRTVHVKTAAQTLAATVRVTNMNFTEDFLNFSSEAYLNFSTSIKDEIYQSLSLEIRELVDSGKVRIEITSLSQGSIVVNFTISSAESYDHLNVSYAVLSSLVNSTRYNVDEDSTYVSDFDECASGPDICSQNATCDNNWGSYTCACTDGFQDMGALVETTTLSPAASSANTIATTAEPATTYLATPTTAPTATTSLATPTTAPTATTSLATPTTAPTATTSLATPTTAPTATTALATPTTTLPTATTSLATPTTRTYCYHLLSHAHHNATYCYHLLSHAHHNATYCYHLLSHAHHNATYCYHLLSHAHHNATYCYHLLSHAHHNAPTATTSLATPTTTLPTATTSLATPTTTLPTATTSLATPTTTLPTATTSLSTPTTTLPTATTSLVTPTTAPTATTSLVTLPTDGTTISKVTADISVECRLAAITVTVAKEFLLTNQISATSLYLGQESNQAVSLNSTHVGLTVAWSETKLLSNNTYYTAQVTLLNSAAPQTANGTASFARNLRVPILCTYRKSVLTSTNFGDVGYDMIVDPIAAQGSFKVLMQLLNGTAPLPNNYSLTPDEDVVVSVALNTSSEEMRLVISQCWATPTFNPKDPRSYVFLNSSCPMPHSFTNILSNGNSSSSSLSVRIFSFVQLDIIYLHCHVQICVEMGSATCVPDCSERTARFSNRFEIPEEDITMLDLVGFSVLGVLVSLLFMGGLICLFFYQRNRIGHYNFNIKPKQESFTFHAFNT
ncbi:hypothetical protein NHX12_010012 [Muraenolepis orangiensis]|uniref:Uromodulin-like 1 n=1 Tax=Muraenolepis orangiensis TaxID=630683 RepID=A0A9Q0I802_9TELE|nr:hypothetical protein NHX12_010012 [Muraenolepis orangiensis]